LTSSSGAPPAPCLVFRDSSRVHVGCRARLGTFWRCAGRAGRASCYARPADSLEGPRVRAPPNQPRPAPAPSAAAGSASARTWCARGCSSCRAPRTLSTGASAGWSIGCGDRAARAAPPPPRAGGRGL
jgi:hypothetical protein